MPRPIFTNDCLLKHAYVEIANIHFYRKRAIVPQQGWSTGNLKTINPHLL